MALHEPVLNFFDLSSSCITTSSQLVHCRSSQLARQWPALDMSLPNGHSFLGSNVEGLLSDAPGFPLPANATNQDLVTFADALALKIYPRGYWQIELALNVVNILAFLCVAVALRAYRSRKSPAPFWLFKLERRPYRVKRCLKASGAMASTSGAGSLDVQHYAWFTRWQKIIFGRGRAKAPTSLDKDVVDGRSQSPTGTGDEEVRMGWFFTASCINCHLVLTGTYVVLLFAESIQSFMVRGATSNPPLFDPGALETLMIFALFSTAYFAAIGYIALLLPNVPPWLWNGTVIGIYVQTIVIGLLSMTEVAVSASKISVYRTYMHLAYVSMPSIGDAISKNNVLVQAGIKLTLFEIAKEAHKESLNFQMWQQIAHGLVAVGGFALALVYLVILAVLCRKVAKELDQLRSSTLSPSEDESCQGLGTAPWSAIDANVPMPLLQAAQLGLQLRHLARAPPASPAPSGPLPLPPIEASKTESQSSTPEAAAGNVHQKPHAHKLGEPHRRFSQPFPSNDSVTRVDIHQKRFSTSSGTSRRESDDSPPESCLAQFPAQDSCAHPVSPANTIGEAGLDLGPRLRLDSDPNPFGLDTLHEDMATHEGYIAVCRFLFNCIIDHAAIMLQCFAFGIHSVGVFLLPKSCPLAKIATYLTCSAFLSAFFPGHFRSTC